ncbi:uncharacterized protein B0H18DRAFT_1212572 [Fomitopsis serialis]|uniref:uncharacterized protein n=1 Tax=Fomitopsis serialis TaxID=139415 RepID=UPI00200868B0|nr:uncharacterized protein B0H18DRAFT_1212572 [Neoantrodia serialis]KAH9922494.1 hypothetical protein B0H18DRAFT_1212572 [Neoantrodia serialis]
MATPTPPAQASIEIRTSDGQVLWTQWDADKRRHVVHCDLCGKQVTLTKHGHAHAFLNEHRGSDSCTQSQRKAQHRREREAASAARRALFQPENIEQRPGGTTQAQLRAAPDPGPCESSSAAQNYQPLNASVPATPHFQPMPESHFPTATTSLVDEPSESTRRLSGDDQPDELTFAFGDLHASSPAPEVPSGMDHDLGRGQPPPTSMPSPLADMPPLPMGMPPLLTDVPLLPMGMPPLPTSMPPLPTGMRPPPAAAKDAGTSRQSRSTENGFACKGVLIQWKAGSVWDTYPYHQHALREYPWEPVSIENGEWFRLRAKDCARSTISKDGCCTACQMIPASERYRKFLDRAISASDYTPWEYLNYRQIVALCKKIVSENRLLRLKSRNADRNLSRLRGKINDHQRLVTLLANHDVKRLHHLLSVALRKGASPKALIAQIERAITGLYSDRAHFEERDIDIAFLVKALGGPRLLYALSKSHGLASVSTTNRKQKIPELLPSISIPSRQDAKTNYTSFCNPSRKPPPPRYGASNDFAGLIVMIDGVSLEERCRYLPSSNAIVGLSREDAHKVSVQVTTYEALQEVAASLRDGKISCGQEATVVAMAPYARTDHPSALPLIASPTNKSETGRELAQWLQTYCDAWQSDPNGETAQGPIWALGSDGDAAFRLAKYIFCFTHTVPEATSLGRQLRQLRGMNLATSSSGIVATCDPKHVIKRFATLIRNPRGIMVNDTLFQRSDFLAHLLDLPNMSSEDARRLLDPADKQNVPKAVRLVQELLNVKELPTAELLPARAHRHHLLSFFAEVLGYFVQPFITVSMSLSTQVCSLATYSHLLAAMWLRHGTAFMTGALYADSQAIVKNIIITTLRLQLLDDDIPFYIILEGTDRLETLFGDCRTQDHSRNFDILQLCQKLSIAAEISLIFERNPDLDRGHRRLDLKDAKGVDRVNPRSWVGDVRVGQVDVASEWARGRVNAQKLITQYLGIDAAESFNTMYTQTDCDLLRPGGTYVGVKYDPDDDRTDADESAVPSSDNNNTESPVPDEDEYDDVPIGLDIEDFLPETTDDLENDVTLASSPEDHFLLVDNKKFFKSSVVTALLTTSRARKVPLRTLRNRGVTFEDLDRGAKGNLNSTDLLDGDIVKMGDLAASLLRVRSTVCLAVVEIIGFRRGKGDDTTWISSVNVEDLEDDTDSHTVSTQVLDMFTPESAAVPTDKRTWQ